MLPCAQPPRVRSAKQVHSPRLHQAPQGPLGPAAAAEVAYPPSEGCWILAPALTTAPHLAQISTPSHPPSPAQPFSDSLPTRAAAGQGTPQVPLWALPSPQLASHSPVPPPLLPTRPCPCLQLSSTLPDTLATVLAFPLCEGETGGVTRTMGAMCLRDTLTRRANRLRTELSLKYGPEQVEEACRAVATARSTARGDRAAGGATAGTMAREPCQGLVRDANELQPPSGHPVGVAGVASRPGCRARATPSTAPDGSVECAEPHAAQHRQTHSPGHSPTASRTSRANLVTQDPSGPSRSMRAAEEEKEEDASSYSEDWEEIDDEEGDCDGATKERQVVTAFAHGRRPGLDRANLASDVARLLGCTSGAEARRVLPLLDELVLLCQGE
ncbi:hypothetical protein V8C86DRAFT_2496079 [Haematococcus lacustris]